MSLGTVAGRGNLGARFYSHTSHLKSRAMAMASSVALPCLRMRIRSPITGWPRLTWILRTAVSSFRRRSRASAWDSGGSSTS
eukprot:3309903-Pyramimonas_sp.AAC.1